MFAYKSYCEGAGHPTVSLTSLVDTNVPPPLSRIQQPRPGTFLSQLVTGLRSGHCVMERQPHPMQPVRRHREEKQSRRGNLLHCPHAEEFQVEFLDDVVRVDRREVRLEIAAQHRFMRPDVFHDPIACNRGGVREILLEVGRSQGGRDKPALNGGARLLPPGQNYFKKPALARKRKAARRESGEAPPTTSTWLENRPSGVAGYSAACIRTSIAGLAIALPQV